MKTLIVIPTYNEVENIEELILKIKEYLYGYDFNILVVDDNSSDGTAEIVKKADNVFLLQRKSKLGLASAYIEGFKFGIKKGFDTFIQMDADFSHNPIYLKIMMELLLDNDVVIGSRNIKKGGVENWGFVRNIVSKCGSFYAKTMLNCSISDLTGGFNGWRKEVLDNINLDNIISKGYCFQIEMKYKACKNKYKIKEFPIIFEDRKKGKSKMNLTIFLEAFLNIIRLKFSL